MLDYLYPVLFSIAVLAGMWITERGARDPAVARKTYLAGAAGGILGARIWFSLQYGELFSRGGFAFFGFFIGATVAAAVYHYRHFGITHPSDFPDAVAPAIALGAGLHRVGCYISGCCFGKVCDLPWAVQYGPGTKAFEQHVQQGLIPPAANLSLPVHPTQLYGTVFAALCALVLFWLIRFRRRNLLRYELFLGLTMSYSVYRFIMEYLRDDAGGVHFGALTFSQASSIAVFTVATYFFVTRRIRNWKSGEQLYRLAPR